jgi:hypothetical protein
MPNILNPDQNEDEDIVSSDDESGDSDNQHSKYIPASQQAESHPVFHQHRNVLASF